MKFLLRKYNRRTDFRIILFVSEDNDERSQMAEGFFRKYAPKGYFASSAGTSTGQSVRINPLAESAMREYGIDISNQKRKTITEQMILNANMIVNIGILYKEVSAACKQAKWHIEAITDKNIDDVRKIRDIIELKVRGLGADLIKKNL